MKTVPEIEAAIGKLSRKEFWLLAKWFDEKRNEVWDREMEEDARPGGPLDKLLQEAEEDIRAGRTYPMEEVLRSRSKAPPYRRARRRRS
jgi:hypothetical protein